MQFQQALSSKSRFDLPVLPKALVTKSVGIRPRFIGAMPIEITSTQAYQAALQRLCDLKEAATGADEEADLIALSDAVARRQALVR